MYLKVNNLLKVVTCKKGGSHGRMLFPVWGGGGCTKVVLFRFFLSKILILKKALYVCESCFFNRCNACGLVFSCSKHFDLHRLGIIDNNIIIITIIVIAIIFIIALTIIIIIIILFIRVVKGRVPKKDVESLVFC